MKGLIIGFLCLGITLLIISGISEAGLREKKLDNQYNIKGIVVEVKDGRVVFEAEDGNVWAFYANSFVEGQEVNALMASRGTTTVVDDEIIFVR